MGDMNERVTDTVVPVEGQNPLPFLNQRLSDLCNRRLSWDSEDIVLWIVRHTRIYLNHLSNALTKDAALRNTLRARLSSPREKHSFGRKVVALCVKHGENLLSQAVFRSLDAGPSRHVARAAMGIYLISFTKIEGWTEAFATSPKGGYNIAVTLVLAAFEDLEKGNNGYFAPLLAVSHATSLAQKKAISERLFVKESEAGDEKELVDVGKEKNQVTSPETASRQDKETEGSNKDDKPKTLTTKSKGQKTGIPHEGTMSTKLRNARKKESQKLKQLKKAELVPPDADFAFLREWRALESMWRKKQVDKRNFSFDLKAFASNEDAEKDGEDGEVGENELTVEGTGKRSREMEEDEEEDADHLEKKARLEG